MPSGGRLMLPPVQLSSGSYVRYRFVSAEGPPIGSPRITRTSFDLHGARIPESHVEFGRPEVDPQGATLIEPLPPGMAVFSVNLIGPLPPGMAVFAVDSPPFARMRLRDVRVTGEVPVIDGGSVVLQQGAVLKVTIVDAARAPVSNHSVLLEEGMANSPLWWEPVRTDANGVATFHRLASGRYYVLTSALEECGGFYPPPVSLRVDAPPRGTVEATVVVDGRARIRLLTGATPLEGKLVSVTPESPPQAVPAWLRPHSLFALKQRAMNRFREASCLGTTDATGRVRFANVPPGPARVALRIGNSTWVRRLELAADDREVVLQIPSGFLPVRVLDAASGAPVGNAIATWLSGGMQVEATASATGDVLLEGVAQRSGTLLVEAQNYQRRELKLAAPPDVLHEVALERSANLELRCRVVTDAGAPIADAVVELKPHDLLETSQVAATGTDGVVRFSAATAGLVRLMVRAPGYAASIVDSVGVPAESNTPTTVRLARGYRIEVALDPAVGEGPHAIRVSRESGAPVDVLLDAASERTIHAGRQASVGPLPPGTYIVELRGSSRQQKQQVDIVDRDVRVMFRE
jgi:hypothetical protein